MQTDALLLMNGLMQFISVDVARLVTMSTYIHYISVCLKKTQGMKLVLKSSGPALKEGCHEMDTKRSSNL